MPTIVGKLGLTVEDLPDFTTVCTWKEDLKMRGLAAVVAAVFNLFDKRYIQAIGLTSLASRVASRDYAKRVGETYESVKTTALVDFDTGAIPDVRCSMNLPHDTQIAWQVLSGNISTLVTMVLGTGFDWDNPRKMLRDNGVQPVINYGEFYSLAAAHNAWIDAETYHHRSIVETIFFPIRKPFGTQLKARPWCGQFPKIVLKAAVRNMEHSITARTQ